MAGYIQFDGIKGEAKDSEHKDWSEISSVNFGINRPVLAGASTQRAQEQAVLGDIMVVKELDKASTTLYQKICDGTSIKKVVIDLVTAVGAGKMSSYLKIELENVIVTSAGLSAHSSSAGMNTEQLSLNFTKIKWTYTPYDDAGKPQGTVPASWDKAKNTP
jgi:type VI secretion system secreted protein Hcp